MAADARLRTVIVEDEARYRDMLRGILSQHPRLEVVAATPMPNRRWKGSHTSFGHVAAFRHPTR